MSLHIVSTLTSQQPERGTSAMQPSADQGLRTRGPSSIPHVRSVLQTALRYLEALRAKVPKLIKMEKMSEGVRADPDLTGRIASNLEAEKWAELSTPRLSDGQFHSPQCNRRHRSG
jgi:hypothetical protein